MSQPADVRGKSRVCNWTVHQDRVLLNLLLDQMKRNYSKDETFKSHVWTDIVVSFNEATRLNFTPIHLTNRWKNLKRTYHLYETLRSRSGWGWDESRQLPIPPDNNAWAAAIASNRRYASIMGKPYLYREEMDILCSKTTCRGRLSFGSNQDVDLEHRRSFGDDESSYQQFGAMGLQSNSTPTEEEDSFDPFLVYPSTQPPMNFNQSSSHSTPVNCHIEDEATSPHKPHITPPSSGRNRKRKGKIENSTLQEYCAISRERMDMAKLFFSTSSSRPPAEKEDFTIRECLTKLKTLSGFTPDILYRGANLFKQADNRAIFMALDDDDKLGWMLHQDI